jgi:hypothetical protein
MGHCYSECMETGKEEMEARSRPTKRCLKDPDNGIGRYLPPSQAGYFQMSWNGKTSAGFQSKNFITCNWTRFTLYHHQSERQVVMFSKAC